MNKKQHIALVILSMLCVSFFWTIGTDFVEATTFTPITQQGDVPENLRAQEGDLVGLLNNLFIIALGAGALLAVLMITIGGIQYMGTDSYSSKDSAKTKIRESVIGLIILLGSWLFLFTINPDLVNLNIFRTAKDPTPAETTTGAPATQTPGAGTFSCSGDGCCATLGYERIGSEDGSEICRQADLGF